MFKELIYKLFNIEKSFYFEPFVYIDSSGSAVNDISDRIKWLNRVTVKASSEKKATRMAFDILNKRYPKYKDKIFLY